jgi:DNA-binding transcriptional LysR family regulator
MLAGEIDLSLLVNAPDLPERLHRWELFTERYILLCPPEHRFRDQESVLVRDLAEECLLLHEDMACPVRRFVSNLFDQHGLRPRRQHFGNSLEQLLEMVQASLGVSLAGDRLPATLPVLRRPVETEQPNRSIVLTVVAGRQLGPTPAMCVKLMRARAWVQDSKAEAA